MDHRLLSLAPLVLLACASAPESEGPNCQGDKCDQSYTEGDCGPVLDRSTVPFATTIITMTMDSSGKPVSQFTEFGSAGDTALSEYLSYDSEGHLTEERWAKWTKDGEPLTSSDFQYSYVYENGKLSKRTFGGFFPGVTNYHYSAAGDLVQTEEYDLDDPDTIFAVSYASSVDESDILKLEETIHGESGYSTVNNYYFNHGLAADQPMGVRIGDAALSLPSTIAIDSKLISYKAGGTFADNEIFYNYDERTGHYVVSAGFFSEAPHFVVTYECASAK